MSRTDASRPSQTPEQAPISSSSAGESSTSAATPAAAKSPKPAATAEVKTKPEQAANPATAAESRAAPSDQTPRAGKRSPGLKSKEAAQAIPKIGQDHDGPPPPSTPLEIASSELWPELFILDFAANEARAGLAGLFACQEPLHRTMYEAGPEAYSRDLEAYIEERRRSTSEIERWRALLKRHALPIGSLSRLREICATAYDALSMIDKWERKRKKEPQWNWAFQRDVVDPFFGVRMPATPVVDYDASKLVEYLFDLVYELAADADRPTLPPGTSVRDALAAFDAIIGWCDKHQLWPSALKATIASPQVVQGDVPPDDSHSSKGSAEPAAVTVNVAAGHEDGPEDPHFFWWKGKPHVLKLQPKQWNLLKCIWPKDKTPLETIGAEIWGDRYRPYEKYKFHVSRLNTAFEPLGIPLLWEKSGNYLIRA